MHKELLFGLASVIIILIVANYAVDVKTEPKNPLDNLETVLVKDDRGDYPMNTSDAIISLKEIHKVINKYNYENIVASDSENLENIINRANKSMRKFLQQNKCPSYVVQLQLKKLDDIWMARLPGENYEDDKNQDTDDMLATYSPIQRAHHILDQYLTIVGKNLAHKMCDKGVLDLRDLRSVVRAVEKTAHMQRQLVGSQDLDTVILDGCDQPIFMRGRAIKFGNNRVEKFENFDEMEHTIYDSESQIRHHGKVFTMPEAGRALTLSNVRTEITSQ